MSCCAEANKSRSADISITRRPGSRLRAKTAEEADTSSAVRSVILDRPRFYYAPRYSAVSARRLRRCLVSRLRLYLTERYRFRLRMRAAYLPYRARVCACMRARLRPEKRAEKGRRRGRRDRRDIEGRGEEEEEDEEETEHAKMQEERAMTKRSSDPIWAREPVVTGTVRERSLFII